MLDEQEVLLLKYKEIEGLPDWPLHLDPKENQIVLKDFTSRIVEELAEAEEYVRRMRLNNKLEQLMTEEVVDALHFFLDLILLVGRDKVVFDLEQSILPGLGEAYAVKLDLSDMMKELSYILFIGRNQLKNKPWKQTELPTHEIAYIKFLNSAGQLFNVILFHCLGWTREEIYNQYHKKNTINQFRQKSNY